MTCSLCAGLGRLNDIECWKCGGTGGKSISLEQRGELRVLRELLRHVRVARSCARAAATLPFVPETRATMRHLHRACASNLIQAAVSIADALGHRSRARRRKLDKLMREYEARHAKEAAHG